MNKISIVVPTKNEGRGIGKVINSLKKYSNDIIVVDANSKDGTRETTIKAGASFILDHGLGKGEAVRIGLAKARSQIIIIFDSDGSPDPNDIPRLVKELERGSDLVITSRRTGGSYDFQITLDGILRTFGSDLMAYLVNKKFDTNLSDILYNFRAIRKSIVSPLKLSANGFDIEQEILVRALQENFKVVEIPSRENARAWGKSKLHTLTGILLLYKLVKLLYF